MKEILLVMCFVLGLGASECRGLSLSHVEYVSITPTNQVQYGITIVLDSVMEWHGDSTKAIDGVTSISIDVPLVMGGQTLKVVRLSISDGKRLLYAPVETVKINDMACTGDIFYMDDDLLKAATLEMSYHEEGSDSYTVYKAELKAYFAVKPVVRGKGRIGPNP